MRRWLLPCVVLLTACSSLPVDDMRRPIVGGTVPTAEEIAPYLRGYEHNPKVLSRSLAKSSYAQDIFSISRYAAWYSPFLVSDLNDAIGLVPENPFAWIHLGAYLALDHHTEAAILATQRGLQLVDGMCSGKTCPPVLLSLRDRGAINLAKYSADADRPLDAVVALETVRFPELSRFEQLIWHLTAVNVKSTLGDVDGARQSLRDAAAIPEEELRRDQNVVSNYPQYFGDQRKAIELYLSAVIDVAADERSRAEQTLKNAVELHPELWDGVLLLSSLQHQRHDYDAAIGTLRRAKQDSKSIFRPERIDYNRGSAYLARFAVTKNRADLHEARTAFENAAGIVERRFRRTQYQVSLTRQFDNPASGQFFLEALPRTPPIYADACNNLGTVHSYLAGLETGEDALKERFEAERQWIRALRDPDWPRRHLAYGNLASAYASIGRLDAAADAADAALDADPLNVVPLRALLERLQQDPMPANAVEGVQLAARLMGERKGGYPAGIFDDFLAPYESRLQMLEQTDEVRKARFLIRYVRAADDAVDAVLREAVEALPEWSWPAVVIARRELAGGGELSRAREVIAAVEKREVAMHDVLSRREQGEFFLLRAEVRSRGTHANHNREARRDIERAMASGIDSSAVEELRERVDSALRDAGDPTISSFAVLPFDTVRVDDPDRIGHALGWSFSSLFRLAGGAAVRNLQRDALDLADWNPESALAAGRKSGIGAVLAGRIARGRRDIHLDVRVFDSVSGESIFAQSYSFKPAELREKQITIANDVLSELRLTPVKSVRAVAEEAFSANPGAYQAYLAGLEILVAGSRGPGRLAELERAESLFRKATDHGKFGRGYAGLALTMYDIANIHRAARELRSEARSAAADAIRLAPQSSEAQLAAALVAAWFEWDFDKGREAFEAAVRLDPYNSMIHRRYSDFLIARDPDLRRAKKHAEEALKLAPRSIDATLQVGKVAFYQGEYDKALLQIDAALTLNPDSAAAYELKSWVYTKLGRYAEALDAIHEASRRSVKETPGQLAHRGVIHALNRAPAQADIVIGQLAQMAEEPGRYVLPLFEARVLLAREKHQAALDKLRDALVDRSESMAWLAIDPWFEALHQDRHFQAILAHVRPD